MSNLSKNQAEVNHFVIANETHPFRKNHFYFETIIPTTIVKDKNAYEITYIDPSMYINGFVITTFTKDDVIVCINVFGEHPNADPTTNAFCLPKHKQGKKLNKASLSLLRSNLKTYYYDSAYFIPEKKLIEYKKLKSMYIQLNQGEQ